MTAGQFFGSSTGHIVKAYGKALKKYGVCTYQGEDASGQPADLADVCPHETAAGWTRTYLRKHPFDRNGSLDEQERRLTEALAAGGRKATRSMTSPDCAPASLTGGGNWWPAEATA